MLFGPQYPRSSGRKPRAGLSIVELLVVIACLAILASILFPMFARTRSSSYRVQCTSNLRQLAAAFYQYALDWGGYWPSPGGLVGDRSYWSQSGNGGLYPYVKQRGLGSVWCCPLLTEWHGKYPPRSYSMNSYLRTPADVQFPTCIGLLRGVCINSVTVSRETILLYEGIPLTADLANQAYTEDQIAYIYRCANWTWVRGYYGGYTHTVDPGRPWHGQRNNYLYCDGHVVSRPPGRRVAAALSTCREMREWFVSKSYFEEIFSESWSRWVPRDLE